MFCQNCGAKVRGVVDGKPKPEEKVYTLAQVEEMEAKKNKVIEKPESVKKDKPADDSEPENTEDSEETTNSAIEKATKKAKAKARARKGGKDRR